MKTYCYRVAKYIGSYVAAMNGVDVICFTAGIGENAPLVRSLVCEHLGFLGVSIDEDANHKRGEEIAISTPDSKQMHFPLLLSANLLTLFLYLPK